MKLKSFKDLETTSKVRTKDLVLPLRIDEQFSSRKKYGVNWGNAGVPNDLFFSQNYLYNVVNASRVFLRQPMLIFNFPGKKIPALHCYPARHSENKNPSQQSCLTGFCQPALLKKTENYAVPASVKWKLEFASQRQLKQVMGQPAKFHLTHCQEKHIS